VNLIAMPDAEQAEVKVAVNDFLKAITASLLMEQVMAPSWKFKTIKDEDDGKGDLTHTIVVEGLKPLSSEKTKTIVESQLDDLKAAVLQDDMMVKALSGSTTAETITQHIIPKIIRERYPDLTDEEIEEVRQRLLLDTIIKGNDIVNEKGEPISSIPSGGDDEEKSEGNRLIKIANRFINIDQLNINLIDTINPFQRAYEVISKSVDAKTLKLIQDTIAEQKYDMTLEQAIILFKGPLKDYVATHDGKLPSMDDPDPKVRELAVAYAKILNQKRRHMSGLEIGE
jgi:hypothetical protein